MLVQCCVVVGQQLDYVLCSGNQVSPHEYLELIGGSGSKHDGDRLVCAYWRSTQAFCEAQKGPIEISLALDKSRPNGLGWGNGVMFYNEADMGFW